MDFLTDLFPQGLWGIPASELLEYALAVLALAAVAVFTIKVRRMQTHSETTKKSVTRLLRKMGRLRSWKVFTDQTLSDEKGSGQADQVVVGPFGVLALVDFHRPGGYYGDLDADQWVITDAGQEQAAHFREVIPNPIGACRRAGEVMRRRLMKAGLSAVPVYTLSVATQRRVVVYIPGGDEPVLSRSQLKDQLGADRYQKDRNVDIDRVVQVLGLS